MIMSLKYNEQHLKEMLFDSEDREDQHAIRFALWCINSKRNPLPGGPPCWREVRGTDDGCTIYQCLSCKQEYEGRTAPGYYNTVKVVDGPGDGVRALTMNGKQVYFQDIEPEYVPTMHYCPFCGIEWVGAVCPHGESGLMVGPRRDRIQAAINKAPLYLKPGFSKPSFWWLVDAGTCVFKLNPNKVNAVLTHKIAKDLGGKVSVMKTPTDGYHLIQDRSEKYK